MTDSFVGTGDTFELTPAQQRYVDLFGGPTFAVGPARNPYTPGGSGRIVAADPEDALLAAELLEHADEEEAALWGAL